ncbi:hypothetical protein MMUR_28640 [Mycolicibacterium murale]|uniref:IclR family transcriptional regulator n=2 Tax=Mycolicibacterium murale TaxID=182220 RepID=A0A7I9WN11_9MYCO|nr:hypothetical protein MMUR_28640 [Mycolicibacterium murale]
MLERGLTVLGTFDGRHPTLRLTDIARRCGLPISTTSRLVEQLVAWGGLIRLDTREYAIGPRIWDLGLLSPVHRELRTAALPFLRDVIVTTRHNVHLAVRDGGSALFVERLTESGEAALVSQAGSRLPLYASGVGKAILAHSLPEVLDLALRDARMLTAHTVIDRDELLAQLEAVRTKGYAVTESEFSAGVSSIGVAILSHEGSARGAIGVAGHTTGFEIRRLAPTLQVAARALARRLDPRADGAYRSVGPAPHET